MSVLKVFWTRGEETTDGGNNMKESVLAGSIHNLPSDRQ